MIFTSCLTNNCACFSSDTIHVGHIHYYYYYYYYMMTTIDEYPSANYYITTSDCTAPRVGIGIGAKRLVRKWFLLFQNLESIVNAIHLLNS